MTGITNLRPGCIGIDAQPPLRPMRRDEDRLAPFVFDHRLSARRRRADLRFCLIFFGCVAALIAYYFYEFYTR